MSTGFDLEKVKVILDEQGLRIADNQENSQKNRRKLAESTRGINYTSLNNQANVSYFVWDCRRVVGKREREREREREEMIPPHIYYFFCLKEGGRKRIQGNKRRSTFSPGSPKCFFKKRSIGDVLVESISSFMFFHRHLFFPINKIVLVLYLKLY